MKSLEFLIEHVNKSINLSDSNLSKLTPEILGMSGMSGIKTRHFYNNLCNLDAKYLEVGTWQGSSFISANYENNIDSIACDNWAEFGGPKDEFFNNFNKYCPGKKLNFIEKDCFTIDNNDLKLDSIDIYLYDGCHKYESHKKAITHFAKFLNKYSIIVIDDWRFDSSWMQVENATFDGINESNLKIHYKLERRAKSEESGPQDYWNGIGILVCEKL